VNSSSSRASAGASSSRTSTGYRPYLCTPSPTGHCTKC
jgi:hypothetical protein